MDQPLAAHWLLFEGDQSQRENPVTGVKTESPPR